MAAKAELERLERVVDRSGVAERIEALLPQGARPRQLSVRTLLSACCSRRPTGALLT